MEVCLGARTWEHSRTIRWSAKGWACQGKSSGIRHTWEGVGESPALFHQCEESQGCCSKLTFDWELWDPEELHFQGAQGRLPFCQEHLLFVHLPPKKSEQTSIIPTVLQLLFYWRIFLSWLIYVCELKNISYLHRAMWSFSFPLTIFLFSRMLSFLHITFQSLPHE